MTPPAPPGTTRHPCILTGYNGFPFFGPFDFLWWSIEAKKGVWKLKSGQKHRGVKIKFFQLVKRPTQVCTSPNSNFLDSTVNFNIFFAYQQTQSMSFLSSLRAYAKWGIESEGLWSFKLRHKAWLAYLCNASCYGNTGCEEFRGGVQN